MNDASMSLYMMEAYPRLYPKINANRIQAVINKPIAA